MPIITCTPIAKQYKACAPDSKRDYDEQRYRANKGLRVMWDDSPKNRSRRGDLFVFVHNGRSVTFHRIDDYDSPSDRLPSWSDNVVTVIGMYSIYRMKQLLCRGRNG